MHWYQGFIQGGGGGGGGGGGKSPPPPPFQQHKYCYKVVLKHTCTAAVAVVLKHTQQLLLLHLFKKPRIVPKAYSIVAKTLAIGTVSMQLDGGGSSLFEKSCMIHNRFSGVSLY